MKKFFNRIFLKGLLVVLPVSLTIFVLVWLTTKAESLFAPQVQSLLGEHYFPGFGILVTLLGIFFVGVLVNNFITGRLIRFFMLRFERLPVVKAIYRPLKDFISLLSGAAHEDVNSVVVVNLEKMGIELIGLVTREDFTDLPENSFKGNKIGVYIPYSYIFGGCTIFVDRSSVRFIDIPADKAMRLALTGWIKNTSTYNTKD